MREEPALHPKSHCWTIQCDPRPPGKQRHSIRYNTPRTQRLPPRSQGQSPEHLFGQEILYYIFFTTYWLYLVQKISRFLCSHSEMVKSCLSPPSVLSRKGSISFLAPHKPWGLGEVSLFFNFPIVPFIPLFFFFLRKDFLLWGLCQPSLRTYLLTNSQTFLTFLDLGTFSVSILNLWSQ